MRTTSGIHIECHHGRFLGLEDVRRQRRVAYGRDEAGDADVVDDYSLHIVALSAEDELVGSLRATCHRDGPLEAQEAYPSWLLADYGRALSACSRLCVIPAHRRSGLALAMMTRTWAELLPRGIRVDVSKVRRTAIMYYIALGFYYVRDSLFRFSRWDVDCGLVASVAEPASGSPFAPVFAGVEDAVDLLKVRAASFANNPSTIRSELRAGLTRHVQA